MIISAAEFWLLDALSEFWLSLAGLCLSQDDYRLWRNELKPEIAHDAVHTGLATLIRAGWVRSRLEFGKGWIPPKTSPLSGLGSNILFGLTPAGGRVWEQIAEPRWREYATLDCLDQSALEDPTCQELLLAEALNVDALVRRVKEYCGMGTTRTLRRLSRPRRLRQWRPNYWKRFDEGVAITAILSDASMTRTPVAPKPWKKIGFTRNNCDRLVEASDTFSL